MNVSTPGGLVPGERGDPDSRRAVDIERTRRIAFETVRGQAHLYVDGRMAGETLRVLTAVFDRRWQITPGAKL